MSIRRVVIVGGSLAGLRAAQSLRNAGFDGTVTIIGHEVHEPYDRPPLSKEVLAGKWSPDAAFLQVPGGLDDLQIDWHLGAPAAHLDLDRCEVEVATGDAVPFDRVVVATGARPRELDRARELAGVFMLRTVDDCLALRSELARGPRVAVVGAGFIGSEVAATCRGRGLDVTLIEALPVPLANVLGIEVGSMLAALHADHGVSVLTGRGVERLEGGERIEGVRLADGTVVPADAVVLGVGVTPNTEWLEGSGLDLANGVVCDPTCRASRDVFSAGDVTRWTNPAFGEMMRVEHWSNAVEQGLYVGRRVLEPDDADVEPFASVPFFWSDQYDRKIQFVGTTLNADRCRMVPTDGDASEALALYERGERVIGALGVNCPSQLLPLRRLMGTASVETALARVGT